MRRSLILAALLTACSPEHEVEKLDDTDGVTSSSVDPDPALVVVEPAAASWHAVEPVGVSGYVRDAAGVAMNGGALALDGDLSFTGTADLARGINVIEVTAEGADGLPLIERVGVIAGEYADPSEAVADGLLVRMNQTGLDTFGDFGETLVTAEMLQKELASVNPIYNAEPIVGTQIQADVAGVAFDQPEIIVTPTPGAVELQVSIPNLVIDIDAYGEIAWIDFTDTAQITADRAILTAEVVVDVVDGQLTAELLDPVVTLSGFGYDIDFLWDELEGLFVETVRTTIEDMLVEQMQEMVPALLADTLSALELEFNTELLGRALTVSAGFASADVDEHGVEIGVNLDVSMDGEGDKTYVGYLAAGSDATASPDTVAPMSLMLSDDMLNRSLLDLWRGGLADVTLSTEDGSLDPTLFDGFPVDTATVTTQLDLPPVIVESDGLLELQIAELQLIADTPGASIGDHMVATVDITAQLALAVRGSAVGLELGDLELGLSIVESDWSVSEDGLVTLLKSVLSPDTVQEALDGLAFELPELYGLSVAHADVDRAGTGYHTSVTVEVAVADAE